MSDEPRSPLTQPFQAGRSQLHLESYRNVQIIFKKPFDTPPVVTVSAETKTDGAMLSVNLLDVQRDYFTCYFTGVEKNVILSWIAAVATQAD